MIRLIISTIILTIFLLPLTGQEKLIKSVDPDPTILRAGIPVTFKVDMDATIYRDYTVVFNIYKNRKLIKESSSGTLFPNHYKKGDRLQAKVKLINPDSGSVIETAESGMIEVSNTGPYITKLNLPDILKPGKIKFKIEAADADKDSLEFSIEGDKAPKYVTIDSETGEVTMEMPDEFPETIEFTVKVDDNSGGTATKDIKFTRKKQEIKDENS